MQGPEIFIKIVNESSDEVFFSYPSARQSKITTRTKIGQGKIDQGLHYTEISNENYNIIIKKILSSR